MEHESDAAQVKRVHDLADRNPEADAEAVLRALEAVKAMRVAGFDGPHYQLASPYGHAVTHAETGSTWSSPTVD
jgi:hypothetical protein